MRSRVYETVERPSVRLSVSSLDSDSGFAVTSRYRSTEVGPQQAAFTNRVMLTAEGGTRLNTDFTTL